MIYLSEPILINDGDKYYFTIDYVTLNDGTLSVIKQYDVTEEIRKVLDYVGDDLKKLDWKNPVDVALFRKKWGFR